MSRNPLTRSSPGALWYGDARSMGQHSDRGILGMGDGVGTGETHWLHHLSPRRPAIHDPLPFFLFPLLLLILLFFNFLLLLII